MLTNQITTPYFTVSTKEIHNKYVSVYNTIIPFIVNERKFVNIVISMARRFALYFPMFQLTAHSTSLV